MSILMIEYPDMKIFNSLTRIFTLTALLGAVTLCTALTKAAAQTPIFTIEGVYVDTPVFGSEYHLTPVPFPNG